MSDWPQDVTASIAPRHEHVKRAPRQSPAGGHRLEQAIHPYAQRELDPCERGATDRVAEEQAAAQVIGALELVDDDCDQFNFTVESLVSSVADAAGPPQAGLPAACPGREAQRLLFAVMARCDTAVVSSAPRQGGGW
jgi:hypothetical protein